MGKKNVKLTQEEAVEEMLGYFPQYDYSKFVYVNSHTSGIVICPIHGEFKASRNNLKYGNGCALCYREIWLKNSRYTPEKAIKDMTERRPEYDFSGFTYVNSKTKGIIICQKHGKFELTYSDIMSGTGCSLCANESTSKKLRLSNEKVFSTLTNLWPEYDFSKFEYINYAHISTVICPKHGEFPSSYSRLKDGQGCPACKKEEKFKKRQEDGIRKMKALWPEYDFSKFNYVSSKMRSVVICPKHGEFKASLESLRKNGCLLCKRENTANLYKKGKIGKINKNSLGQEEAIKRMKEKHPQIDLSKFVYTNFIGKSTIICPIHGEDTMGYDKFMASPTGCKSCSNELIAKSRLLSQEEVITTLKGVWGDRYDFSKFVYKSAKYRSIVVCSIHGEFPASYDTLRKGVGCPDCGTESAREKLKHSQDFVIKELKRIWKYEDYDFSEFEYTNAFTKSIVICPEHGRFPACWDTLRSGSGCPFCKASSLERQVRGVLKDFNIQHIEQKRFDDCRNILPLPFDFYLPKHNMNIECQGIQHMEEVEFFGGLEQFKYILQNDKIKYNFCIEEKINILYVLCYWSETRVQMEILFRVLKIPYEDSIEYLFGDKDKVIDQYKLEEREPVYEAK